MYYVCHFNISNIIITDTGTTAIAGFSNTDGGILFIGVNSDGFAVGLKNDYSLVKNNADGFQLELRDSIKHFLKNNIINDLIDIRFHKCNAQEICEIIVYPSPVPITMSLNNIGVIDHVKGEYYAALEKYKEFEN